MWWNCVLCINSNNGFFFVVFFLYNHNGFVKVMDAIIFQCIHKFIFYAECSEIIVVSIGQYSCLLYRIWRTYSDCGLFDMM